MAILIFHTILASAEANRGFKSGNVAEFSISDKEKKNGECVLIYFAR